MNTHGPADPRAEAVPGINPGHQGAVGSSPRAGALASLTPSGLLLAQRLLTGVHLGVGGLVTEHHRPLARVLPRPFLILTQTEGL